MLEVQYMRRDCYGRQHWESAHWVAVDRHNIKDARHQFRSFVRSQVDHERYRLILVDVVLTGRSVTRKSSR